MSGLHSDIFIRDFPAQVSKALHKASISSMGNSTNEPLQSPCGPDHSQSEDRPKTNDNAIAKPFGQRRMVLLHDVIHRGSLS